jgi:hypothetical protein
MVNHCLNIPKLCILSITCICVPYDSHHEERLFPQTLLTGWALRRKYNVFPVRYELNLYII